MKRILIIGAALMTLAPWAASAAELPNVRCAPTPTASVCKDPVPLALFVPGLSCELCSEEVTTTPKAQSKSNRLTSLCEAIHSLPLLSGLPDCEHFQSKVESLLASSGTVRTAM